MKQTLTVLLCALLCACGTTSTLRGEQQTDYVVVSHSQASGIWQLINGSTTACKLTTHGVTGLDYTIEFDGETCQVSAAK